MTRRFRYSDSAADVSYIDQSADEFRDQPRRPKPPGVARFSGISSTRRSAQDERGGTLKKSPNQALRRRFRFRLIVDEARAPITKSRGYGSKKAENSGDVTWSTIRTEQQLESTDKDSKIPEGKWHSGKQ